MKDILVTTGWGGMSIHMDSTKHVILEEDCFGLTWNEDRIFALHRERTGIDVTMNVLNESLELVGRFALGKMVAPHQIYYWDGVIFITDTGQDRIVVWDVESHDQEVVYIGNKPDAGYLKNNHINSIWCDGERFYICEHKCGPSSIRILDSDWNSLETLHQAGGFIHNVYVENGKLYTCDSWGSSVLRVDLATGERKSINLDNFWGGKKPFPQPGYPAGLVRTKDLFYVGIQARSAKSSDRVAVFTLNSDMEFVGLNLLDEYEPVSEMRLAQGIDYAHNRIPMPWDGTIPNA